MSTTRKTAPGAGRAKARRHDEAEPVAGAGDAVRRKPARPKPKPGPGPGKRSEVNDAHDRYANIEVT